MTGRHSHPGSMLGLAAVLMACQGDPGRADASTMAVVESLAVVSPAIRGFNDGNLVALLDHIAAADSTTGAIGARKANSPEVRAFGEKMMREHAQLRRRVSAARQSTGAQPALPQQEVRERDHRNAVAQLDSLPAGPEWDRAYLDHEIRFHEHAIDIAQRSGRDATHAELRTLAEQAARDFESHLQEARQLRERIGSGAS